MDTLKSGNIDLKKVGAINLQEAVEKLCDLAAWYRTYRDYPEKQRSVITEYLVIFNQLYAQSGTELLDIECLLPDEYLPEDFVRSLGFSTESSYRRV